MNNGRSRVTNHKDRSGIHLKGDVDVEGSRQFKTAVPQGGILSPTLFNIYTADFPEHWFRSCLTQLISPSDLHTQARVHT